MKKLDLMIVTGASRGIGRHIAQRSEAKSLMLISSSSSVNLTSVDNRSNKIFLHIDIADTELIYKTVSKQLSGLEGIKSIGVALCAAQIGEHGGLFNTSLNQWDLLYRTNVLGNLAVIKALEPHLRSGGSARVVFFAGGGAAYGYPEFSGYALTKVAVVRAVENLGLEFKQNSFDASIIALAPGAVATDMLATVLAHGGSVKTHTNINEPAEFVRRFIADELNIFALNGRFVHVRDLLDEINFQNIDVSLFKLRRIE